METEKYLGWYTCDKVVNTHFDGEVSLVKGAYDVYALTSENGDVRTKLVHTDGEILYRSDNPYEISLNHVAEVM